ncbi:MAG: pyridoxal phosphate-dependent aminotransferase [Bacteroidota bacterium]
MFNNANINFELLRSRAYNLRWATVDKGIIPLTAADPDFPSAPQISEAIRRYAADRYYCYGPPEGLPEFKESIARFFTNKRAVAVDERYTLPVDSAAFGIFLTCKAFLDAGDEAIIFDPVDFLFRYSVEALNATAVSFPIPPGTSSVDFGKLEELITPRTKLICLCNPLNPTGKVFTREELLQLGEIAIRHNVMILSDEIWSDIVFAPNKYVSIASLNETIMKKTIVVTGFSKSYGLAGLRIGAVIAPNESVFKVLMDSSLHLSTIHGVSVLSQLAATTALNECSEWLDGFVNHLAHMKDIVVRGLNSIEGIECIAPEGCYVAFANITGTGYSSQEMHDLLMDKARVAVVPGLKQWFGNGAEGYIRLSFATSEEVLSEAMSRIHSALR